MVHELWLKMLGRTKPLASYKLQQPFYILAMEESLSSHYLET